MHGKFHAFMKKCTILPILGAVPLYYIDYVQAKVWSSKNLEKVATASSFTIVHRKSEGKSIEGYITKTFPEGSSLPCNKYVMYFYQVTYILYGSNALSFIRNIINFRSIECVHFLPSKNGRWSILMM